MKKYYASLGFLAIGLFLVAGVMSQTLTEDFEDDTPGSAPTTSFGTWNPISLSPFEVRVALDGHPFGSQALFYTGTGPSSVANFVLSSPQQFGEVSMKVGSNDASGAFAFTLGSLGGSVTNTMTSYSFSPSTCTAASWVTVEFSDIDYDAQTYTRTVYDNTSTPCGPATTGLAFPYTADALGALWIGPQNTGSYWVDDIVLTPPITPPDPPAGLRVEVTNAVTTPRQFQATWSLSPTDPNPSSGAFQYDLYYDSGGGATLLKQLAPLNAVNGVYGTSVTVSSSTETDFWVVANITGVESDPSCTVTVFPPTQGDSDQCGTGLPGFEDRGSDLTGDDGALFGGDKEALALALQISTTSLSFLMGLMLTLLIIAGGFYTYGPIGAAGAALMGVILSYSLDLFPFWSLYVLGFLLGGGAILYVKSRGAMSG